MSDLTWVTQHHLDEPRDQQTDLAGPFWASVGPDARRDPDGWSWTVMDFDDDNAEVAAGFAAGFAVSGDEAKAAVAAWADEHAPVEKTCKVIRFRRDADNIVIDRGLTLDEAQAWCQRDDTHGDGWFGYEEETS